MNASFEPLHLVNTYGAFGAVTRERLDVVIKGTDAEFADASAEWREYEFKGKPGDMNRPPCIVSPYHWKLDWQMWFAAMSPPDLHPWFLALVQRLLEDEKRIVRLFAHNPFPDAPPKFIRADWYRYRFTKPGERGWWTRTFVAEYLPAVTLPRRRDAVREFWEKFVVDLSTERADPSNFLTDGLTIRPTTRRPALWLPSACCVGAWQSSAGRRRRARA